MKNMKGMIGYNVIGRTLVYLLKASAVIMVCLVVNMPFETPRNQGYLPFGGINGCKQTLELGDGVLVECLYQDGFLLC